MRARFVLRLALREGRSALRRIGVFASSIALGVAALVTIHGLREDMSASVRSESEALLGADVRLSSNAPFPDPVLVFVDSLSASGIRASAVTTVLSMVMGERSGAVRLLQVRGVEGGYPFYGSVLSRPDGAWQRLGEFGIVLVEPDALAQLGSTVGDTLLIGEGRFVIAGTVESLPADLGLQAAAGPRVYVSAAGIEAAGLLTFGSLARREIFLEIPDVGDAGAVRTRFDDVPERQGVRFTTAEAQARELTRAVDWLGRYLGLVGLAALLLGAVGVASAVHVFVREKLGTVAILRCLGARQSEVLSIYVLLTAGLGLIGSVAGALLGVSLQLALPSLLSSILPLEVASRPRLGVALGGVGVGLWVSVLFALAPLLTVRDIPPLLALRRDFETPRRRLDPARGLVALILLLTVGFLAVREAPEPVQGLAFALGVASVVLLLRTTAGAVIFLTRRLFPSFAPYPVRQGVANLFRPRNQTVTVTLALGVGAFLIGTILQIQTTITRSLTLEIGDRPNLVLFDVQPDQRDGVLSLLPEASRSAAEVTPIVPARIARVTAVGEGVAGPGEDSTRSAVRRPDRWALRREYRHTFRDYLTDSETLVGGAWFDALPARVADAPARVSMEVDLASSLAVTLGDTVVWDVGGVEIPSVVTSLRAVEWGQFTTNFFVVFEPGILEAAPRMDVVLAHVENSEARMEIQRRLVTDFPNVSALDVDQIAATVSSLLGKVGTGVRFLALACALAGTLVLIGALSTSRFQRTRETALLRTLGARRRQVFTVLLTEYVALGTVAAAAGLILAAIAGGLIGSRVLDLPHAIDAGSLVQVWFAVTALTVVTGLLMSITALRSPPLPVLREIAE